MPYVGAHPEHQGNELLGSLLGRAGIQGQESLCQCFVEEFGFQQTPDTCGWAVRLAVLHSNLFGLQSSCLRALGPCASRQVWIVVYERD